MNMFLKLIQILMTHFLNPSMLNASMDSQIAQASFVSQMATASLRKCLMLTVGVVSGLVVFIGGALTVLLDLVLSSRDYGQLALSSVSAVGFSLIAVSLLTMVILFRRQLWQPVAPIEQPAAISTANSLAPVLEMVAGLVQEILVSRQQPAPSPTPQAPPDFPMASSAGPGQPVHSEPPPPISNPTYN